MGVAADLAALVAAAATGVATDLGVADLTADTDAAAAVTAVTGVLAPVVEAAAGVAALGVATFGVAAFGVDAAALGIGGCCDCCGVEEAADEDEDEDEDAGRLRRERLADDCGATNGDASESVDRLEASADDGVIATADDDDEDENDAGNE